MTNEIDASHVAGPRTGTPRSGRSRRLVAVVLPAVVIWCACGAVREPAAGGRDCVLGIGAEDPGAPVAARECYDLVSGLEGREAAWVRCHSIYDMRGIPVPDRERAAEVLWNTAAPVNSNLEAMSMVIFAGASPVTGKSAADDATELYSECEDAMRDRDPLFAGHVALASLTRMATVLGGDLSPPLDGSDLERTLPRLTGEQESRLGAAAKEAYFAWCTRLQPSQDPAAVDVFCGPLVEAGADRPLDDAEVGAAFAERLAHDN